ncbi:MAG: hypothetical protein E7258_00665 [Lachnospiraceae bacterium]|nr:hypothetical protein [Lachnospiraceae bacterium]
MGNASLKKTKYKHTEKNTIRSTQIILWNFFLLAFFGIYPIVTNDKYFNITKTRYNFVMIIMLAFVVLFFLFSIMKSMYEQHYGIAKENTNIILEKWYKRPEFWMEAFMLANIFACFISITKKVNPEGKLTQVEQNPSILGQEGRYMGMVTYLMIAIVFLIIVNGINVHKIVFWAFAASTFYAYIIGIFQHAGLDFMGYRKGIAVTPSIYISTFGNINIFASFLAMSIPVFMCVYIFEKNKICKYVSAILTVLGGMCLLVANSDSGFLGAGTAIAVIFLLSFVNKKTIHFFHTLIFLALGICIQIIINESLDYKNDRGGIAEAIQNIPMAVGTLIILLAFLGLMHYLNKRHEEFFRNLNRKKIVLAVITIAATIIITIVILAAVIKPSVFTLDRKWGNYRGMIWNICGDIYEDAPMVNKLFGYGNEAMRALTVDGYYEEMIKYTSRVYDNAHNEVLQYLVTIGLVGALSYVALFITGFLYILKNAANRVVPYICLTAMTGYFVQGLVNINQPITTPFFFIFMAVGIGYIRESKKSEVPGD